MKIRDILAYIIVYMSVLTSGSLFYQAYNDDYWLILLLFISTYLYIRKYNAKLIIDRITKYMFILLFIITIHLSFNIKLYHPYFGLFNKIIISYLIYSILKNRYFEIYVNFIVFLAAMSMAFFIDYLYFKTFTQILSNSLPLLEGWQRGIKFYNMLFLTFPIHSELLRNQSIFWEPGAFQFFLNIALIINLENDRNILSKKNLILITAIISTFSTTGYIVLGLIIINYMFKVYTINFRSIILNIGIFFMLIFVINVLVKSNVIIDKIDSQNLSFSRRIIDTKHDLVLSARYPILGIGYGNQQFWSESSNMNISSSSNSLTTIFAQFGIFVSIYYLLPLFKKKYDFTYRLIWYIIVVILLSTENFLFTPVILIMIYSSINVNINRKT